MDHESMGNVTMTNEAFINAFHQASGSRPPLIVAELSGNHNQSLERGLHLIDAAADCGVDAIKLQTYTADTITLDVARDEFVVNNPQSVWHGRTLHSLYAEAHTPWDWHRPMLARAAEHGLACFSSPFDFTAIDFLEKLDVPCYKIASPELVDLPLIARAARTGKPLIMSTGMASLEEIGEAVTAARTAGATHVMLLKCTTDYPASPKDSNLRTIADLALRFGCPVGVSDHTLGIGASIAATVLGAPLIEKHLTLCRADGGPDAHFSLEPSEMAALVRECRAAHDSLGAVVYGPRKSELGYMRGRRSLYICADLSTGDRLTPQNLRSIRPGFGLPPKHYEAVLGRTVKRDIPRGTPLAWEDLLG
jgi:pseudaminic acid synthase